MFLHLFETGPCCVGQCLSYLFIAVTKDLTSRSLRMEGFIRGAVTTVVGVEAQGSWAHCILKQEVKIGGHWCSADFLLCALPRSRLRESCHLDSLSQTCFHTSSKSHEVANHHMEAGPKEWPSYFSL